MKKFISSFLITVILLLLLPVNASAATPTWEIKNRDTAGGSNVDVLFYKGTQKFSQSDPTGTFKGNSNVSLWTVNDTDFSPKIILAIEQNSSGVASKVMDICFPYEKIADVRDPNSQMLVKNLFDDQFHIVTKVFVLWQLFGATGEQSHLSCFGKKDFGSDNLARFLGEILPGQTANITMAKNIVASIKSGDTNISFYRPPLNDSTKTACKKAFIEPQFKDAADREKAGNEMKQAIIDQLTEMATSQGKGDMLPGILEKMKGPMDNAVDQLKSSSFADIDLEMYKKYYSSNSSLGYPDVRLTQNLYMDAIVLHDEINTALTAATVGLTENQQKISLGLNILAGVAIAAVGVATVVPIAGMAAAAGTVAASSAAAGGAIAAVAAKVAAISLVGALGYGTGLALGGFATSFFGDAIGQITDLQDGKFTTPFGQIEKLYKNDFDKLFKLYMANAYVTANNNYNACALAQKDDWAVVNDKIVENLNSLLDSAYGGFAAATLSAFGDVCDTISGHGMIGDALYKAFCNLGLMLKSWADSLLNMAFCYLQTSVGYISSKSSTWSSCKRYTEATTPASTSSGTSSSSSPSSATPSSSTTTPAATSNTNNSSSSGSNWTNNLQSAPSSTSSSSSTGTSLNGTSNSSGTTATSPSRQQ